MAQIRVREVCARQIGPPQHSSPEIFKAKEGARQRVGRDLDLVAEWFEVEDEAWAAGLVEV